MRKVTIESVAQHPNADRLKVYQVVWLDETSHNTVAQVIANLTNVYEVGDIVWMVPPGDTYEGVEIKSTKVRGVLSEGMLVGKVSECNQEPS